MALTQGSLVYEIITLKAHDSDKQRHIAALLMIPSATDLPGKIR